jgi:hypothetical protein
MLLADDNHVGRYQQPPENPSETHHLGKSILAISLDHQEIEVASIVAISASTRAEQYYPGRTFCRLDQSAPGTLNGGFVGNSTHRTRSF